MRRTRGKKIDVVYKWKTAPKLPVRLWFGKFSAWKSLETSRDREKQYSKYLDTFFAAFPKRVSLEQFTSVDVADYKLLRRKQGMAEGRIVEEVDCIFIFWRWLIEQKGLPLRNIAERQPRPKFLWHFKPLTDKHPRRTIQEAEKLLAELPDLKSKRILIGIMKGERCANVQSRIRRVIYAAAAKAGLENFRLAQFKLVARSPLAVDIVKAYCNKLLDALTIEAKSSSDTFTAIKSPPLNEWTTISNSDSNLSASGGILQEKLSPKGEILVGDS